MLLHCRPLPITLSLVCQLVVLWPWSDRQLPTPIAGACERYLLKHHKAPYLLYIRMSVRLSVCLPRSVLWLNGSRYACGVYRSRIGMLGRHFDFVTLSTPWLPKVGHVLKANFRTNDGRRIEPNFVLRGIGKSWVSFRLEHFSANFLPRGAHIRYKCIQVVGECRFCLLSEKFVWRIGILSPTICGLFLSSSLATTIFNSLIYM